MHVVAAIPSFVQKIVIFVVYILLAKMDRQMIILIPYLATASEEMVSYYKIVIYALYQTAWLSHLDVRRWSRLVKEFRRYFYINRRSEECI